MVTAEVIPQIGRSNQIRAKKDSYYIDKAYNDPNSVVYEPKTDTLYIAGTHSTSDLLTDLTLPIGMLNKTDRYQSAKQLYELYGRPRNIVSHSLGGSIALELNKEYNNNINVTTYGSPVVDINPFQKPQRRRHYGDPVSMMDFGATSSFSSGWNPHSVL